MSAPVGEPAQPKSPTPRRWQALWLALCGGALIAVLLTGGLAYFASRSVTQELAFPDDNIIHSLAVLSTVERKFLLIRVNALYHLSYTDPAQQAPHAQTIRDNIAEVSERLDEYGAKLVIGAEDARLLARDRALFVEYLHALEQVLAHSRVGERVAAMQEVERRWKPAGEQMTAALAAHTRYKEQLVEERVRRSLASGQRSGWLVLLLTLTGLALLAIVASLLWRSLQHVHPRH